MPEETAHTPVTAFMLVKTTPEWLALTVEERVHAFTTEVVPVVRARTAGVRSRCDH
ncbi:darcynin family protein, partial [Streptomyces sp. E5N91]|uniref:darcynin family protein n=1 Tax=Streptomyces sp. E5N91 TaxID=1851996 RepID=UPI0031BA8A7F